MSELQKELRLGNAVKMKGGTTIFQVDNLEKEFVEISNINNPGNWAKVDYGMIEGIPITKESIEKYIDWGFEKGFNKQMIEKEYWVEHQFLMENAIDGSSDFEIIVFEHKGDSELNKINYYIDDKLLEFGLDDTLHNLQNLFFISCGQELPIKKY